MKTGFKFLGSKIGPGFGLLIQRPKEVGPLWRHQGERERERERQVKRLELFWRHRLRVFGGVQIKSPPYSRTRLTQA
jgi:hypothetical protein